MRLVFLETPLFTRHLGDYLNDEAYRELQRMFLMADDQIWFVTLYDKDEAADLVGEEKKILRKAIQAELNARRRKP